MSKTLLQIIMVLVLGQSAAFACNCEALSLKKEVDRADHIFVGKVISINLSTYPIEYQFEVSKVWKGERKRKVEIFSGIGSGDCGVSFINGKEYLIFARKGKTDICRRNEETAFTNDMVKLDWHFNKSIRKKLLKGEGDYFTGLETNYFANLLKIDRDFIEGKRIKIFDNNFTITKVQFFHAWGGRDVPVEFVPLNAIEAEKYGIDAMIVAWPDGQIVSNEKIYLLERLRELNSKEEIISKN